MKKMNNQTEIFRRKLENGAVVGFFSKTSDPGFIEAAGFAGADFVILDLEHGPNSVQSVQNLIRAAQVADIFPIVRVKENCEHVIGEVLDIGAGEIQIPQISSAKEVRAATEHIKFAPEGNRGVCRFVRAAEYSALDRFEYFKTAGKTCVILQIEGVEGIRNLQEILQTNAADVIFIGPYDLSASLGLTGQIDNPAVEEKMLEIIKICEEKGVTAGTFVDTPQNVKKWKNLGVKYLAYSVDMGIFHDAVKNIVTEVRNG